jgi:hypothetical protein
MSETTHDPHRQQRLYWNQMLQLKGALSYTCLYRNYLGRWVTGLGALRAIASCGGIAAWAIWKEYAFIWGTIIAVSQVMDALKDVFPFAKLHKACSEHAITLSYLFVDAELEWESVYAAKYADDEIMSRIHKLKKVKLDAEGKSFPDGLFPKSSFRAQAEQESQEYFAQTFSVE